MAQSAVVGVQRQLHEAEVVDTDWATTGISFLKGVHLLVPHVRPPAHHPPPTADTGTAATKGTDAVILAHSQTAASPVTSDLSCQDEIRKGDVAAVVTEIEDVEEETGDEEEEEKPIEGDETWKKPIQLLERRGKVAMLVWISMTLTEKPKSRVEQLVSTSSFAQSPLFCL